MKAHYKIDAGDIRVIRPFAYVRETATRDFSVQSKLPIINENCPACFEQPKERDRIKKLLAQEEAMVPALFYNLRRAFLPLMHEDTYVAMEKVSQMVEAISKEPKPPSTRGKRPAESELSCTTLENELDHSPMTKKIDRKEIATD
jgi:tRNA(Ile)-lysidine synthase TilS/MesJ